MKLFIRNFIAVGLWTLPILTATSQTPIVTSFTPTSGIAGTIVTITGTNFDANPTNNLVLFGSAKGNVTSATPTQLTVSVPSGALNEPISVLNIPTGLKGVSNRQFLPTFANCGTSTVPNFEKIEFANGSQFNVYSKIAAADMDGDDKSDIISGGFDSFYIYRNIGTPGAANFIGAYWTTNVNTFTGLAIGDLTGDGKPEVITTNPTTNKLVIRKNSSTPGSLAFGSVLEFSASAAYDNNASIGDIDGDGKNDVVILGSASAILIFRNTSTAGVISFAPVVTYPIGFSVNAHDTKLADFNGDGKLDIAVDGNSLSIFQNLSSPGAISLSTIQVFTTIGNCGGLSTTDLDSDGKSDIAVVNRTLNSISIFRNTSSVGVISFSARIDYPSCSYPYNISTGDIDGDSDPDIAVISTGQSFSVLKNLSTQGSISFSSKIDFTTGETKSGLIGDFDYDNQPDMLAITYPSNLGFFKNIASCVPPYISSFSPASGLVGTTITITGNNFNTSTSNNVVFFGAVRATVQTATATQLTVTVPAGAVRDRISITDITTGMTGYSVTPFQQLFNCGSPITTSALSTDLVLSTTVIATLIKDLDGDGKPDIAAKKSGSIEIYRNSTGNSSITLDPSLTLATGSGAIFSEDFNGDGKPDLITNSSASITLHKNLSTPGAMSFATRIDYQFEPFTRVLNIHDLDGDGKADIIAYDDFNENELRILKNTSTQNVVSYQKRLSIPITDFFKMVRVVDMNGDKKPDLLIPRKIGSGNLEPIAYYENITPLGGPITFAPRVDIPTEANLNLVNMTAGDVDGDGKPDIIYAGQNTPKLSVLKNTTTAGVLSFATVVDFQASNYNRGLVLTDLDGDGKPEPVMLEYASNSFMIFKNNSVLGTISLAPAIDIGTFTNPKDLVVGDFNIDGKTDLLITVSDAIKIVKNSAFNVTGGVVAAGQTICTGGDPAAFTQTTASTGPGTISYQWQSSLDNIDFGNISGATATTYNVPAGLTQTTIFRRITSSIQNGVTCQAPSNPITVTVNSLTGGTIAANQTICSGGNPVAFTQTSPAVGPGTLSYQWQKSPTGTSFSNITGATATTYDAPSGLTQNTYYKRNVVSSLCGLSASSNPVLVSIDSVNASITPASKEFCIGQSISVTLSATSGAGYAYQWKKGGTNIVGATSSTYQATQTGSYTVTVTNSSGCQKTSNAAVVSQSTGTGNIRQFGDLCADGYVDLVAAWASAGSNFMWSTNETTQTIRVYNAGTYSVNYTTQAGCVVSANILVELVPNPGPCIYSRQASIKPDENEIENKSSGITLYPNPADATLTVHLPEPVKQNVTVSLYSQYGQEVKSAVLVKGEYKLEFDTKLLSNGMYVLTLRTTSGNINMNRKVIINH